MQHPFKSVPTTFGTDASDVKLNAAPHPRLQIMGRRAPIGYPAKPLREALRLGQNGPVAHPPP